MGFSSAGSFDAVIQVGTGADTFRPSGAPVTPGALSDPHLLDLSRGGTAHNQSMTEPIVRVTDRNVAPSRALALVREGPVGWTIS